METFAEWLAERARAAGYDIDGARGGGKAALADEAGVSRGQISRTLAGETIPDVKSQRAIAHAIARRLRTDRRAFFREMLIRSGTLLPDDLEPPEGGAAALPSASELDLESVAESLGIPPESRRLFVEAMQSVAAAFEAAEKTRKG